MSLLRPYNRWEVEAMGRANKRRVRPDRNILLMRQALDALKLRWVGEVSFFNPRHVGKSGRWNGGLQWIDLVVRYRDEAGSHLLVVLFDKPSKRWKDYEKVAWTNKVTWLSEHFDTLILKPNHTSQEYRIFIWRKIKRLQEARRLKELGYAHLQN